MKYTYFVSYTYNTSDTIQDHKFDHINITRGSPITSYDDILLIQVDIRKIYPDTPATPAIYVKVLSWQRYDKPE